MGERISPCWHGGADDRSGGHPRRHVLRPILAWSIAWLVASSGWLATASPQNATTTGPVWQPTQDTLLVLPPDSKPLIVRCAFHLEDIDAIDDEHQTFEFSGTLSLVWQDARQAFDPATAHVAEKIYQGDYQFNELSPGWFPQINLANANGAPEITAVTLRIAPDGTCTLTQTLNAAAEGKLNLRVYPFDRQRLELVFQMVGFDAGQVKLQPGDQAVNSDSALAIRIPQWTVQRINASPKEYPIVTTSGTQVVSAFVVEIDVQRHSLFMMRLVVVPLALIVVLSWSVFWMDRSSLGDRINVSFIGILTAVAYQIVVGGILPRISYVTWMNAFLNVSFWIMCATVVVNIAVGEADKRGQFERGDRIDRRCRWLFPLAYGALLAGSWLLVSQLS